MSGATLQKGTWTSKNIKILPEKMNPLLNKPFYLLEYYERKSILMEKQQKCHLMVFLASHKNYFSEFGLGTATAEIFRRCNWVQRHELKENRDQHIDLSHIMESTYVVSVVFQRLVGWVTTCDQLTTCSKGTDIVFTNKNKLLNDTNKKSMMIVRIRGARIGVAIRIILTMIINTMTYTYLSNYGRHLTAIGSIIWNVWENLYNPTHPLEDFSHEYPLNHP